MYMGGVELSGVTGHALVFHLELAESRLERAGDVRESEMMIVESLSNRRSFPGARAAAFNQLLQLVHPPNPLGDRAEKAALVRLVVVLAVAGLADTLNEAHLLEEAGVVADTGLADAELGGDFVEGERLLTDEREREDPSSDPRESVILPEHSSSFNKAFNFGAHGGEISALSTFSQY